MRSKAENKGRKGKERIAQVNDKDVFCVLFYRGQEQAKTDEGRSQEMKVHVWENREQGTESGRF